MIRKLSLLLTALVLVCLPVALPAQAPTGCDLAFAGSARKAVKLRTKAAGDDYEKFNDGNPISVTQWFTLTCALDGSVPSSIPATKAMEGIETAEVTLRGFLQGVKFEENKKKGDGKDNDFHIEVGGTKKWESPHVVVETPPGNESCDARKRILDLIKKDGGEAEFTAKDRYIFVNPPRVLVTGYVFLDSTHGAANFCVSNGGRGIQKNGTASRVRGLWEIHPVFSVKVL